MIQSYSIAYAFLTILTCSRPGTVLYIAYCTSSGIELLIPPRYISFVYSPSGSMNTWCLSLSANLTTLSSIEGQYLGPVPCISPEYNGERSILSFIILCVSSLVYVSQQLTCSFCTVAGSVSNEKGTTVLSPNCSVILLKSMERLSTLAGVPVLNLLTSIPLFISDSVRWLAA